MFEVWESEEDAERFRNEVLIPLLQSLPTTAEAGPPQRDYTYPLHGLQHG